MPAIRFHEVYVGAHPGYAGHTRAVVDRYDDPRATLAFWLVYHDSEDGEGEILFYADLLFCDSIQTIVVLDYYAFRHSSVAPSEDYVPHIHIPRQAKMKACIFLSVREVLSQMYPGYKTLMYNKGHFQALQDAARRECRYKTNTLAKVLPWDIVDAIYDQMEPAWVRHRRVYWPKRWDAYKADWEDRVAYKRLFYNGWETLHETVRASKRDGGRVFLGKLARVVV